MTDEIEVQSEIDALKDRAKLMGISFHPSIGVDALKAKIQEKLDGQPTASAAPAVDPTDPPVETQNQMFLRIKQEQTELIRIRAACMNPAKKEWEGEIFTTGNRATGTIKKYVPFDVEYHVPRMILSMMQERMCQVFHTVTDPKTGNKSRRGKLVKEFAIEILTPLTPAEIKDLAQRQAMANGTSE